MEKVCGGAGEFSIKIMKPRKAQFTPDTPWFCGKTIVEAMLFLTLRGGAFCVPALILLAMGSAALTCRAADGQIGSSLFVRVTQSTDASPGNGALKAMDGTSATSSLTADVPGSYWLAELGRAYFLSQ